jgi:hypothetical protein
MFGSFSIVAGAVALNLAALWKGFHLIPAVCIAGVALNVLSIPFERFLFDVAKRGNLAYTIFCLPFIVSYAVLLIVR